MKKAKPDPIMIGQKALRDWCKETDMVVVGCWTDSCSASVARGIQDPRGELNAILAAKLANAKWVANRP